MISSLTEKKNAMSNASSGIFMFTFTGEKQAKDRERKKAIRKYIISIIMVLLQDL